MDCVPNESKTACCVCGWKPRKPLPKFPRRACPVGESGISKDDVAKAAESLGVTPADAWKFCKAIVRWIKAGRPKRTPEEVARLYAETCAVCKPHFVPCKDGDGGRCQICRCNVSALAVGPGLTTPGNKITMATEHCPAGKW
jgi:hypothetical protein